MQILWAGTLGKWRKPLSTSQVKFLTSACSSRALGQHSFSALIAPVQPVPIASSPPPLVLPPHSLETLHSNSIRRWSALSSD